MRWSHNNLIIARVQKSNHRETYAGLLWWQGTKGYKSGWVAMKFKDIFGKFPRPLTTVEPEVPSHDLREYIGIMTKRWKQKKKREEAKRLRQLGDLNHEDKCGSAAHE